MFIQINAAKMYQNLKRLRLFQYIEIQLKMIISTLSFVPDKQFGQLINISPNTLTMMNTINTEFSFVEVQFTDQISKTLEIENNVNVTLIIGQ